MWQTMDGPLPIGRSSLDLPSSSKPVSFRYAPTCLSCYHKGTVSYQYPHGDGKNYDYGSVRTCKLHDCTIEAEYIDNVCDDFILSSWELRGIRKREERIAVLLDLRQHGIEVKGPFRNMYAGDMLLGNHPDQDKDILGD
jgi:hypothetical protein